MELSDIFMQPLVTFLAGILAGAGTLLIVKFLGLKKTYACQVTVQIVPNGNSLKTEPDDAYLYLGGEITWDNQLNENATVEFEQNRGRPGPFPNGTFPLGKKAKRGSGNSNADPGPFFSQYWKYSVTSASGKKLDPGVVIKK
jgi:hypothetical protein